MKQNMYDLTTPQKSILLTDEFYKGTCINNICGTAIIEDNLDFNLLKEAINLVIKNNDSFRFQLCLENNEVKQYIKDSEPIDIELIDVASKEDVVDIENKLMSQVFDIYSNLYTFKLFRFPNGSGGFSLNIHHIISDSWTLGLIAKEIVRVYSNLKNEEEIDFSTFSSYVDYIESEKEYRNSNKFIKDKEYWNSIFSSIPETATIPSMKKTSNDFDCTANRLIHTIDENQMKKINDFCTKNRISAFNFFMAIYSIYIGRVSGLDDFVIGTPILNRTNFKEKNTSGMFINIAPFRICTDSNLNFKSFASNLAKDSMGMLRHQKYSYQYILEDLRKQNPDLPNLYHIMLSYQVTKANTENGLSYETRWAFNGNSTEDLDIHLFDINATGCLNVAYDYRIDKYSKQDIDDMHERIVYMINQVLSKEDISIGNVSIVTPKEKYEILYGFNDTDTQYPTDKTVIQLFEEQVEKTPDYLALIFENERFLYKELNEKANQLAHFLVSSGVRVGDTIAIMVNRSSEMIIGLLAIFKVGANYLPIDPEYPKERIFYMLENSETTTVLVHNKTKEILNDNWNTIDISLDNSIYQKNDKNNLKISYNSDSTAYLIYTSGSTGNPKGVMVSQQNLHNFIIGMAEKIDFSSNKVMASLTTISFDIFGLEIWVSLSKGLCIVLANELQQNSAEAFNQLCQKHNVNIIQTTPSRFHAFLENTNHLDYFKNLTDILVGGEALPQALLEKFQQLCHANIYNVYGPTETTIWSTIKDLTQEKQITVGTPISNTTCFILDKNQNLLPPYTPGELYIGGDGVSKGYWKREDLNKERFISRSFSDSLIYNTGDLAYFTKEGEIVHLGRTDFQVKIRGYRIELGEIEKLVIDFPNIITAVVVSNDNKFLSCYYTSSYEIDEEQLSDYLIKRLPYYMIPSYFKRLDEIPLTPNGKIDRKRLPNIIDNESIELAFTKTEKLLSSIIQKVLECNSVDINSPFLSLGLDSLGLIEVQTLLIQYGINLSTQDFYRYPSIKNLAKYLDSNMISYSEVATKIPARMEHNVSEVNSLSNENILGNVFLSGANGFIGVHVLQEILSTTDSNVYCLVRGNNIEHSTSRLLESYSFYFKSSIGDLINKRVFVLCGDIIYDHFNLNNKDYINLQQNVNTIIHTAAIVKHYGDFENFKIANIDGTRRMADFAYLNKKRFIHISSISVSGNYLVRQDNHNVDFSENDIYIGQHYTDNVYVNSKFEAEKIVYSYVEKGLVAEILRIGILSGRHCDGVFQKNIDENAFYNRIKSIVKLQSVSSEMLKQQIELTPVDFCAKAIVLLAKSSASENKIFHLYNHNLATIEQILDNIKKFNIDISILSSSEFENRLIDVSKNAGQNSILNGIINDISLNSNQDLSINYNYSVNIKSDYTLSHLKSLGFSWPCMDNAYIDNILTYMREVNFI